MKCLKHLLLFVLLPSLSMAQTRDQALQSIKDRQGWYAGLGLYYANQTTHWKYNQTAPSVGTPYYNAAEGFGHDLNRASLSIAVEKKSLFGKPVLRDGVFVNRYDYYGNYIGSHYDPVYNFVDFDFGADLMISPTGKAYANYLEDGVNEISSGGLSAGASAFVRMQWLFITSSQLRISAFSAALGAQFMHVHNNGGGSASSPLVKDFNYNNGWNENLTTFFLSVGILNVETKSFSILPEVRVLSAGFASTSLKPQRLVGDVKMESGPFVLAYGIKVLKKL